MAHKLIKGKNLNGSVYKINTGTTSMSCSDGHQGGNYYIFQSTDREGIIMLLYIMSKMNMLQYVYRMSSNKIAFGYSNGTNWRGLWKEDNLYSVSKAAFIVRYFYKMCRYLRNNSIRKVLERTINYHKNEGMSIYNAFFMAHFIDSINYYATGMDIIYISTETGQVGSFITKEDFKHAINTRTSINYIHYLPSKKDPVPVDKNGASETREFNRAVRDGDRKKAITILNESENLRPQKQEK